MQQIDFRPRMELGLSGEGSMLCSSGQWVKPAGPFAQQDSAISMLCDAGRALPLLVTTNLKCNSKPESLQVRGAKEPGRAGRRIFTGGRRASYSRGLS